MLTSIMVPLDGSAFGERALPLAAILARRAGARLMLVHVHAATESPAGEGVLAPLAAMDRWDAEVREAEQLYLRDVARRLKRRREVDAELSLVSGQVVDALQTHAARVGVDLVVMSTHGRGGLARAWLGSVADGLLRRLSIPILLVKPAQAEALSGEWPIRRVLVPLDGSRASETALEMALTVARLCGATMRLLMVVTTPTGAAVSAGVREDAALADVESSRANAEVYLERLCRTVSHRGVAAEPSVLIHANVVGGILEQATADGCDLIAMATHGRGSTARLLLGSVTDQVVRNCVPPVLVRRIPRMRSQAVEPGD